MHDKPAPDATTCPLIGFARDRWTRFQFPDSAHRCWARKRLEGIDLNFQSAVCLRPDFRDCIRYRQSETSRSASGS